jgi:hypothetical protein
MEMSSQVRSPISIDLSSQADNVLKMLDSPTVVDATTPPSTYQPPRPGTSELLVQTFVDETLENEMADYLTTLKDYDDSMAAPPVGATELSRSINERVDQRQTIATILFSGLGDREEASSLGPLGIEDLIELPKVDQQSISNDAPPDFGDGSA